MRIWGVDDGHVTLNGEKIKLHGWNHHTQWLGAIMLTCSNLFHMFTWFWYTFWFQNQNKTCSLPVPWKTSRAQRWLDTGASPTDEQLDTDMALLKEGRANFVRGAHYPQDQRWLDRLDMAGFAMWEETLGPGVSVEDMQDWSHFMKYQLQQVEEMLEASMNHPSIMVWAWFNEGPSNHQEACPAYAACAQIAGRDPTRLLSWASNKQQDDKCLEYATAVSFNGYPAWYSDQHQLDAPARFWNQNAAWVRDHYPHKPFFISETGAGGLFEWDKNTTNAYWTLKYQQEVIDRDVDVALGNENVSGLTLWHFFDFKGNDGAQACGPCHYKPDTQPPLCAWYNMTGSCGRRPGGLNHKGVVDAYRRKKPSFESVKAKYGRNPPQIMIWWSDDLNKKSTFRRAWRRKEAEGASDTSGFNTDQHHCFVLTRSHRVSNQALKMPIDHLPQPCAFFSVYDGHQAAADNLSGYGPSDGSFLLRVSKCTNLWYGRL